MYYNIKIQLLYENKNKRKKKKENKFFFHSFEKKNPPFSFVYRISIAEDFFSLQTAN